MQEGDRIELRCGPVVAGGAALCRAADGRVVLADGALPGERVSARIVQARRDHGRAEVVDVVEAAPERVAPHCPAVAAGCGGCDWQHVRPDAQPALKAGIVRDALVRLGRVADPTIVVADPLGPGGRTTVRVVARGGGFGMRRRASHDVVALGDCPAAHPLVREALVATRFGPATREATFRAGVASGDLLVVVDRDAGRTRAPDGAVVVAAGAPGRAAFVEVVHGRAFRVPATAFFQARPDGAALLVDAVARACGDALRAGARLVDAYGGVGLLGGCLADRAGGVELTLVESHRPAARAARANLADLGAAVAPVEVGHWRAGPADLVVADPARPGLGRPGVGAVVVTGAPVVVLVSCDPASAGRDAALLRDAGYRFERCEVLDLFPDTSHVEAVSRFVRA